MQVFLGCWLARIVAARGEPGKTLGPSGPQSAARDPQFG